MTMTGQKPKRSFVLPAMNRKAGRPVTKIFTPADREQIVRRRLEGEGFNKIGRSMRRDPKKVRDAFYETRPDLVGTTLPGAAK